MKRVFKARPHPNLLPQEKGQVADVAVGRKFIERIPLVRIADLRNGATRIGDVLGGGIW
jgi:hypothetical protein